MMSMHICLCVSVQLYEHEELHGRTQPCYEHELTWADVGEPRRRGGERSQGKTGGKRLHLKPYVYIITLIYLYSITYVWACTYKYIFKV